MADLAMATTDGIDLGAITMDMVGTTHGFMVAITATAMVFMLHGDITMVMDITAMVGILVITEIIDMLLTTQDEVRYFLTIA